MRVIDRGLIAWKSCVPFYVQQQCINLYKNTFLNFLGTNTLSKYCHKVNKILYGRALRTLKSNK